MDTLIQLDDSMSDEEVFSEDREVQDVLMRSANSRNLNRGSNVYMVSFRMKIDYNISLWYFFKY